MNTCFYLLSELKRKYLQLSLQHHPDKNGGKTSDTFIAIDKAWKVLSDDKQRSVYDAEQANAKLVGEQGAAIWRNVLLSELSLDDDLLCLTCRCGGLYSLGLEEVEELRETEEPDVLVDCDTCSLNILVSL